MTEKKESTWDVIQKHLMTGIGYMIPLIISYTLVQGFINLIGSAVGVSLSAEEALQDSNALVAFGAWIIQTAAPACQDLMYPVFAGYLAYSIGSKAALIPGFIGGLFALNGNSGFIGALAAGFSCGYFMKWLVKTWKVPRSIRSAMNLTVYPAVGGLFVMTLMYFIVNPIGSVIMTALTDLILSAGDMGAIPFAAIIGGMMAFDCGGPVNKAAFTVCTTLMGTGINIVPLAIGAHAAPLGFGLAYLIDRFAFKSKILPEELQGSGIPALFMGFFNVTEGALPAVLYDPAAMVPINVIGTATGAVVAQLLGAHYETFAGYVMFFDVKFLGGLITSMVIIAVLMLFRMKFLSKKRGEAVEATA